MGAEFDPKKLVEVSAGGNAAVAPKKEAKAAGKPARKEAALPTTAPSMDDELAAPRKDNKDPFSGFPKSDFILDEFKRVYSNEDIKLKAIPYFWDHFDKENFSIWLCEYKYPEDLGLMFQ